MSGWILPLGPFDPLPQRDAETDGKALERSMTASAGGYSGIKTVEWQNADGSVTKLRTRFGHPVFETSEPVKKSTPAQETVLRGFVAKIASRTILFDPYTLSVLKTPFPIGGRLYSVMDFATAWNVQSTDNTHWFDVVLFDGTTIKVNAKVMPSLLITADHGFPAIPYVINRNNITDQYGSSALNSTEKRVFAVGRDSVKSWGGGSVTELLTPSSVRTAGKAMTIGQRIDRSTDAAWLGQIYFTGQSWDDDSGAWAFSDARVQMLLSGPYLSRISSAPSVDLPPATLPTTGQNSSGSINTAITLPETAVGLIGIAEVESVANVWSNNNASVVWPYRQTYNRQLAGHTTGSYTRKTFSASQTAASIQAGITLSYAATNSRRFDDRAEGTVVDTQTLQTGVTDNAPGSGGEYLLGNESNTLKWSSGITPSSIGSARGVSSIYVPSSAISGTNVNRIDESQFLTASVSINGDDLVNVVLSDALSSGPLPVIAADNSYYLTYLANPYGWVHSSNGMGISLDVRLREAPTLSYYKNPSGYFSQMPSGAVAEIQSAFDAMQNKYVGTICYDYEGNAGFYHPNKYTASISQSVTSGAASLTWTTKDYLLYDTANDVKISIESTFAGSQTAGSNASVTITALLRVKTRYHNTTQTLAVLTFTYADLCKKSQIGATGKYAVPSPKIRAMFAPLYQEQGSFKGAAYVTQAEETAGALPAHLFRFRLFLRMYGDFGSANSDNDSGEGVYYVPVNMLEMLYSIVFSQDMGVGYSRYPVTAQGRFDSVQNALFSAPFAVNVRDGVSSSWTDAFGADFASAQTASLHRV